MTRNPRRSNEPIRIDAQDASGGEIILRKRRNRAIFVAGLIVFAVGAIGLRMFG